MLIFCWFCSIPGSRVDVRFLLIYKELARRTAVAGILRWPVKPKHHVSRHVCQQCFFLTLWLLIPWFWLIHYTVSICLLSDLFFHLDLPASKMFQELCFLQTVQLYNMRFYHCYIDEDCIGTLKGLCRRVHKSLLELRVLLRFLLRLQTHRPVNP